MRGFTAYLDVAQVTLYAFWVFFAGLIFYLRREDKREGYPLDSDRSGNVVVQGFPAIPPAKTFLLRDGSSSTVPAVENDRRDAPVVPSASFPGAPMRPTGNPMLDGVGPASYANRRDVPDATNDGHPVLAPMRALSFAYLDARDPDPRGFKVLGADGAVAGVVTDVWIDRSETLIRYLEVELAKPVYEDRSVERPKANPPPPSTTPAPVGTAPSDADIEVPAAAMPPADTSSKPAPSDRVLLPMTTAIVVGSRRLVRVKAILARQFADVPRTAQPEQITKLEEDRVMGYFGGGYLYATPQRAEPLL